MRRRFKRSNVYAFIDSQNLNITVQRNGWKMDWKKFRQFLQDKYGANEAYMFIGYMPEYESLYEQMHNAGYKIVLKPTFDMTRPRVENEGQRSENGNQSQDDKDKKPVKGNIDADMVLWAMKEMKNYDKALIVSGDGDFYSLVEYLAEQGKLLKVLTPGSHYSGLYNKYDDYIERLDHYKNQLAYYDRHKSQTNFEHKVYNKNITKN